MEQCNPNQHLEGVRQGCHPAHYLSEQLTPAATIICTAAVVVKTMLQWKCHKLSKVIPGYHIDRDTIKVQCSGGVHL